MNAYFPKFLTVSLVAALTLQAPTLQANAQEVERADGPPAHVVALRAAPAGYDFELKADLFALYEDGVVDTLLRQSTWRMLATGLERSFGFGLDEVDGIHVAIKRDTLPDRGSDLVFVLRGTEEVGTSPAHKPSDMFDQSWVVVDGKQRPDVSRGPIGMWSPAPGALVLGDPAWLHDVARGEYRGGTPHEDLMVLQSGRPAILQAAWRIDPELVDGLIPFSNEAEYAGTRPFGGRIRIERHDDGSYHAVAALRFEESGEDLEPVRSLLEADLRNEEIQTVLRLAMPQIAALRPEIHGNEIRFSASFEDGDEFAQVVSGPFAGTGTMLPLLVFAAEAQAREVVMVQEVAAPAVEAEEEEAPEEEATEEEPVEEGDPTGKGKDHKHKHKHKHKHH